MQKGSAVEACNCDYLVVSWGWGFLSPGASDFFAPPRRTSAVLSSLMIHIGDTQLSKIAIDKVPKRVACGLSPSVS